jgi:hypothetical protein
MSTFAYVNTFTHSVTYVTDKLLLSLKEIIRGSGLSPERLADQWYSLHAGIRTWLNSRHLETVILEVFDPGTDKLIGRWDFDIFYSSSGEGGMWVDTNDIRYHILKSGRWPSACDYRIVVTNKPGRPVVLGWSNVDLRSTSGFIRQSLGTTIGGNGHLHSGASYWRKE